MEMVSCIVAAAGRSERMGRWKPLLPFRGSTIIQAVVSTALAACGRVVLVAGYRADELSVLFASERRVDIVFHGGWPMGMFSSIQAGAGRVDDAHFFVALGDMPFIRVDVYRALRAAPPADAVFPVFGGRRGHPVLLSRAVRAAVLEADARTGSMPAIISRFKAAEVPWPDDSILRDIDTPEQYAATR